MRGRGMEKREDREEGGGGVKVNWENMGRSKARLDEIAKKSGHN